MEVNEINSFLESKRLADVAKKLKLTATVFRKPLLEHGPLSTGQDVPSHFVSAPHSSEQAELEILADTTEAVATSDVSQNQEPSIAPDETEHHHQNGPFRDAVELPNVSPKIYVYPHSGSEIPYTFQDRFREVVNLFKLNTEQHSPLKAHLEHIDYELRMCGTSASEALPSILVFCRPNAVLSAKVITKIFLENLREERSRKSINRIQAVVQSVLLESPKTTHPVLELGFCGICLCSVVIVPNFSGGGHLTSTIGCILQVDSRFYGLTAAHSLHQRIETRRLLETRSPEHDNHAHAAVRGTCANSTIAEPRVSLSDDGSSTASSDDVDEPPFTARTSLLDLEVDHHIDDDDHDFVDDVEYHDLTGGDQEAPMVAEYLEPQTITLEKPPMWGGAIFTSQKVLASSEYHKVPDNDWALVDLHTTGPQLPNALFDTNCTSQPTFFSTTPGSLPGEETLVLIVALNHRVLRGLLQPVPSFIGGITRKEQAEYWTVVLFEGEALRPGDSGSIVIGADGPARVFGHVVASNPLGEVYVSPLGATMDQIRELLSPRSVSLPDPLPVLSRLASYRLNEGDDYAFELLSYLYDFVQTTEQASGRSSLSSWISSYELFELQGAIGDSLWSMEDPGKRRILQNFSRYFLERPNLLDGDEYNFFDELSDFSSEAQWSTAITPPQRSRSPSPPRDFAGSTKINLDGNSTDSDIGSSISQHSWGEADIQPDDELREQIADKPRSQEAPHQTDHSGEGGSSSQGPSG